MAELVTRERLIGTAIDHFGRLGFDGANTRDIAQQSCTTMSAITYHFGGKSGLYLAAADHVAARVAEQLAQSLTPFEVPVPMDRQTAIEALLGLLDSFAQMMLNNDAAAWSQFIMREQQQPSEAFSRLYNGIMRRVEQALVSALQIARADLAEQEVRAAGILLLGQAMILRSSRQSVMHMLRVLEFDDRSTFALRAQLRANALRILETQHIE